MNQTLPPLPAVMKNSASLLEQLSFRGEESAGLRSLAGWKKSYRIPDGHSDATREFAIRCAEEELKQDLDRVYGLLRKSFLLTRRKLSVTGPEYGSATIHTPYFNYTVTVSLHPAELDAVLWAKRVDAIQVPKQLSNPAFAEVFDNVFSRVEFSLPAGVDLENFIDQVEEANHAGVSISYDREATYCELELSGAEGTVTLTADSLSIVHDRPVRTEELLKAFDQVRKLVQQHDVPINTLTIPTKKLPPPG